MNNFQVWIRRGQTESQTFVRYIHCRARFRMYETPLSVLWYSEGDDGIGVEACMG